MRKRRKNSNFLILILVLLLLLLIGYIYLKNPTVIEKIPVVTGKQPEPAVTTTAETTSTVTPIVSEIPSSPDSNGTIKLAAFNLQVFGTTKAGKPEVMSVLSKIIRNYDIIAVQEIRDSPARIHQTHTKPPTDPRRRRYKQDHDHHSQDI